MAILRQHIATEHHAIDAVDVLENQHLEAWRADGRMVDGGAAGTEAREQDGERNNYRGKQGTHGLHNSGEHNRATFLEG
jgi:hypothetical protein